MNRRYFLLLAFCRKGKRNWMARVSWVTEKGRWLRCGRFSTSRSRRRGGLARILGATIAAAGMASGASAATVNWTSPSDGLWREEFRWSSNPSLPGTNDDAVIDVAGLTIGVTVNLSVQTVRSVFSNERFTIESGGLTVSNNSTFNSDFTL